MQTTKKCSDTGCIHWAWQDGKCKFHYANTVKSGRSPSIGSPYEYMPELNTPTTTGGIRRPSSDIAGFDLKRLLSDSGEATFAMVKPDAAQHPNVVQAIAARLVKEGYTIMEFRRIQLTPKMANELYSIHKDKVWFSELRDYVTGGCSVIFSLKKENAIRDLRKLVGPTDPLEARKSAPDSLRALYGTSKQSNALHCSDSLSNASRELDLFFPCHTFNVDHHDSSSSSSTSATTTTTATTTTSIDTISENSTS